MEILDLAELSPEEQKEKIDEQGLNLDNTEKKKSVFKQFYQLNKANAIYIESAIAENPKAMRLLLFFFRHMDDYNAIMCSYKVIQEVLGVSRQTASNAVKYLKEKGFIYIYKSGTSNVYVANKNLAWKSWGNNWKYSKFPSNILISSSEQEDNLKKADEMLIEDQTAKTKTKKKAKKKADDEA